MSKNDNAIIGDEQEAITAIHTDLSTVKISKPEIDAILEKVPSQELHRLMESVSHLDRNNCLTRHTFEKISVKTRKTNFNFLNTYHLIKELDRQAILNQRNIDLIFNSNSSFNERMVWKFMMPSLIDIGYFNQDNLDRVFLHPDFENLMESLIPFCAYSGWFLSKPDYLDKMIAQKELKNFSYIAEFIPDSMWQDWDKLIVIYDKLIQCNAQLGNRELVSNLEKRDYRYLEEGVVTDLLDRCIEAATPEAAIKIFADKPRPLSLEETHGAELEQMKNMAGLHKAAQQPSSSRVERTARSLSYLDNTARLASNLERSVRSIGFAKGSADNAEYSSQNRAAPPREDAVTQQNYSVNDTLLLGNYAVSGLLQALGFKNISPLANNQPAFVNESVIDFKAKKINHLDEQVRAAEKQYEGNNNSSVRFSSRN